MEYHMSVTIRDAVRYRRPVFSDAQIIHPRGAFGINWNARVVPHAYS